jgi:nucleoid-associated protein YgaU|tara:strand:+ start:115 stop:384 length:270 start_codon:yes stop_codon:yes gene_type:complete
MNRYTKVSRKVVDKVSRIGTAYLPKFKESNSDTLLIATDGDRCDLLAGEYYGDPSLWWFIASINNLSSNNIKSGTQLRIPLSSEQAVVK